MYPVVLGAALIGGAIAIGAWSRRRDRRLYPQDFAFAVSAAFGPELALPREVRIRRVFPSIGADLVAAWLRDFTLLDAEIDRLARCGGPQRLGTKGVKAALQKGFPFLVGRGLRQAMFLVWYAAAHDGYDKSPDVIT